MLFHRNIRKSFGAAPSEDQDTQGYAVCYSPFSIYTRTYEYVLNVIISLDLQYLLLQYCTFYIPANL
jgi:hypothetical protein